MDGCRGARSEGLFASEASGPQKTKLSYIFSIIPIFKKKIPTFSWPFPHSHIFLKNLAGHPGFNPLIVVSEVI